MIWLAPCHHISQSFELPPQVSQLAHCHHIISQSYARDRASASARRRVLPYHCISQSFDLPPATNQSSFDLPTATTSSVRASTSASTRDRASAGARHRVLPYHRISQSFDLPPATTSSHLTCPLPPHQSVIWHCHHISQSFDLPSTTNYHIGQSFDLPPPPHQSIIWLAPCHQSGSHLTCPLPPHHYVPTKL